MQPSMKQFGEPLLTRKSEIATKAASSKTLYPLEVMGKYQRLKQITVRIGLPVYRMSNGRTRTFQREYLATHPDAAPDLFTKDPDSLEAQRAQHQILRKLAEDEDLLKEFQSGTQQTEPVIVTSTGVVVNGNRRLCVWRTLFYQEPEKYKHFEFVDLAVLPEDCDEEEIKALEKRLQIQKTHRAEYKWHNKAAMMKEEREAGATPEQLAKSYDVTKKEVDTLIGALEYAEIYLRKIGKPDQWSIVDGDEFAFKAMVDERKKITDQGRKELFEAVCFTLIEHKDYQGRLYSNIPDIAENLDAIAAALQEKGLLQQPPKPQQPAQPTLLDQPQPAQPSQTAIPTTPVSGGTATVETPASEDEDDIDLLGGETTKKDTFSELAAAVQGSGIKLGGLVKQITDEQKSLKSEQKSAKYLINALSSVAKSLWNVRNSGLNDSTITEGARAQIDTIEDHLKAIKSWLDTHQKH